MMIINFESIIIDRAAHGSYITFSSLYIRLHCVYTQVSRVHSICSGCLCVFARFFIQGDLKLFDRQPPISQVSIDEVICQLLVTVFIHIKRRVGKKEDTELIEETQQ